MRLLSLRQLRRFNGNYQLSQLSQFFFEMTMEIRMVTWKQGLNSLAQRVRVQAGHLLTK